MGPPSVTSPNRVTYPRSPATSGAITANATRRPAARSRALYTSPIPLDLQTDGADEEDEPVVGVSDRDADGCAGQSLPRRRTTPL
jgi:hypothetical protein